METYYILTREGVWQYAPTGISVVGADLCVCPNGQRLRKKYRATASRSYVMHALSRLKPLLPSLFKSAVRNPRSAIVQPLLPSFSNPQSAIRIPKSFDQSPLHFGDGQGEEDKAENQQKEKGPQQAEIDKSKAEGSSQGHQMGERQNDGDGLSPRRQIIQREEGAAEKEHGGDEEEDGQVEGLDVGRDSGEKHADGAEGNAAQECQGKDEQALGPGDKTEQADNAHHQGG